MVRCTNRHGSSDDQHQHQHLKYHGLFDSPVRGMGRRFARDLAAQAGRTFPRPAITLFLFCATIYRRACALRDSGHVFSIDVRPRNMEVLNAQD